MAKWTKDEARGTDLLTAFVIANEAVTDQAKRFGIPRQSLVSLLEIYLANKNAPITKHHDNLIYSSPDLVNSNGLTDKGNEIVIKTVFAVRNARQRARNKAKDNGIKTQF